MMVYLPVVGSYQLSFTLTGPPITVVSTITERLVGKYATAANLEYPDAALMSPLPMPTLTNLPSSRLQEASETYLSIKDHAYLACSCGGSLRTWSHPAPPSKMPTAPNGHHFS